MFERKFQEHDTTCPGGGRMEWRVSVEEPRLGSITSFIAIEEGSTAHDEKDVLLLDVPAAKWLYKTLGEAIEIAKDAEKKAEAAEAVKVRAEKV
jgi:hypothetical protein